MSLDDLAALSKAFGPGGGALIALGMLAIGVLFPVLRRERTESKEKPIVDDRDLVVFMAEHNVRLDAVERRIARLEAKYDD